MSSDHRLVSLPAALCERAEQRFGQRFSAIEQLLTFVLEELLQDDATAMDEAEQLILEQRLRDLGYL